MTNNLAPPRLNSLLPANAMRAWPIGQRVNNDPESDKAQLGHFDQLAVELIAHFCRPITYKSFSPTAIFST
jgi:hypothetical protein